MFLDQSRYRLSLVNPGSAPEVVSIIRNVRNMYAVPQLALEVELGSFSLQPLALQCFLEGWKEDHLLVASS